MNNILITISILFSLSSQAQSQYVKLNTLKNVNFNIDSNKVKVADFKTHSEIILPEGFTIETGNVYFTGNGFINTMVATFSGNNLSSLLGVYHKMVVGTKITFVNIIVKSKKGRFYLPSKQYILY